jgi:hypothetical protein
MMVCIFASFSLRRRPGRSLKSTAPAAEPAEASTCARLDRHPLASVGSLVLGLRCSWCPGSAPMPKIAGLHAMPLRAEREATL